MQIPDLTGPCLGLSLLLAGASVAPPAAAAEPLLEVAAEAAAGAGR